MTTSKNIILGLDLGQQSDYTVLTAIHDNRKENGTYDLIYIKKYKLKTSYVTVVKDIYTLISNSPILIGSPIVIDATGVGRPVVDMFLDVGTNLISATITSGMVSNWKTVSEVTIPKKEIASVLQVVLQNRRLKIPSDLEGLPDLQREFLNFKVSISNRGGSSFNASSGYHDDIVMSLGLAIWFCEFLTSKRNKIRIVTGS